MYSVSSLSYEVSNLSKSLIPFENIQASPVYKEVLERNGSPVWIGPAEHPELGLDGSFYYQLRIVKNFYNLEDRGMLLLQVQFGEFDSIFNMYDTGKAASPRFLIVNAEGLVQYDNNQQELLGTNVYRTIKGSHRTASSFDSEKVVFASPSILSFQSMELDDLGAAGWSLVSIIPPDDVSGQMNMVMDWIAILMTVILAFAFIFNFVFVNRIIRFHSVIHGRRRFQGRRRSGAA